MKETTAPKGYSLSKTVYKIVIANGELKGIESVDGAEKLTIDRTGEYPKATVKNDATTGKLQISKLVHAPATDSPAYKQEFEFTINFKNASGAALTGSFASEKTDAEGNITKGTVKNGDKIKLCHNESVYIKGLPDGAKYTITETVDDNYKISYSITDFKTSPDEGEEIQGNIAEGVIEAANKDNVLFRNSLYTSVVLDATKIVEAGTLEELESFQFGLYKLSSMNASWPTKTVQTKTVDKETAKATFEELEFYTPGTYYYGVAEILPAAASRASYITYSIQHIVAEIVVSYGTNGMMQTKVSYYDYNTKKKLDDITITNYYSATGGITFTATKQINDGATEGLMKKGLFNFEMKDEKGKVVATGTNDENGKIQFSEIEYALNKEQNDLGTHTYTIQEVNGNNTEWTYDTTSYKVTVEVKDNYDGTLAVVVKSVQRNRDQTTVLRRRPEELPLL